MRSRIYQRAKTAMQSGRAGTSAWILEYPRHVRATPERLMGWHSSSDTLRTVRLAFPSLDDAIAYAETNELDYIVMRQGVGVGGRRVRRRSYADNFAFRRRESWTH